VKTGGGNAGHNGLRSISVAKDEQPWVEDLCRAIADHASLLAQGDDASFANKLHLAMEGRGWGEADSADD
jgi:PTH1 family peptidyl-tRNA hydrolase